MEHLSEEFWSDRYRTDNTGWDIGFPSPPIANYIDQLEDQEIRILIPGCGNAYEAEYLHQKGFKNVHIIDLSNAPLKAFLERVNDFPEQHVHQGDFFDHEGEYDLILEQTMFCAIDPELRSQYAEKASGLLSSNGKLAGVLFDVRFESGPPYGGSKEEYLKTFGPCFSSLQMEPCHNSIPPRMGRELFILLSKKQ